MGWLIGYGVGCVATAVLAWLALEGDFDRAHWARTIVAIVAWPVMIPALLLMAIFHKSEDR